LKAAISNPAIGKRLDDIIDANPTLADQKIWIAKETSGTQYWLVQIEKNPFAHVVEAAAAVARCKPDQREMDPEYMSPAARKFVKNAIVTPNKPQNAVRTGDEFFKDVNDVLLKGLTDVNLADQARHAKDMFDRRHRAVAVGELAKLCITGTGFENDAGTAEITIDRPKPPAVMIDRELEDLDGAAFSSKLKDGAFKRQLVDAVRTANAQDPKGEVHLVIMDTPDNIKATKSLFTSLGTNIAGAKNVLIIDLYESGDFTDKNLHEHKSFNEFNALP
jgi:hypothetical protein